MVLAAAVASFPSVKKGRAGSNYGAREMNPCCAASLINTVLVQAMSVSWLRAPMFSAMHASHPFQRSLSLMSLKNVKLRYSVTYHLLVGKMGRRSDAASRRHDVFLPCVPDEMFSPMHADNHFPKIQSENKSKPLLAGFRTSE